MRKRWLLKLDRYTGKATYAEELIEEDASVEQRIKEMHEAADPDSDVMFMSVICNGCGLITPLKRPELPEGWVTNSEGEFCPSCRRTYT